MPEIERGGRSDRVRTRLLWILDALMDKTVLRVDAIGDKKKDAMEPAETGGER